MQIATVLQGAVLLPELCRGLAQFLMFGDEGSNPHYQNSGNLLSLSSDSCRNEVVKMFFSFGLVSNRVT